jgi:hypothetical protein
MAASAALVRVAVTGAVMKGPIATAAPSGTGGTTTGFIDLGYISEDGVEITLPDAGDSTPIKAWQNGTTVRTIRTPSEDSPTWHFTMLETKKETIEAYFGVTVTSTATEGSFTYTNAARPHESYLVDVVDGAELIRDRELQLQEVRDRAQDLSLIPPDRVPARVPGQVLDPAALPPAHQEARACQQPRRTTSRRRPRRSSSPARTARGTRCRS